MLWFITQCGSHKRTPVQEKKKKSNQINNRDKLSKAVLCSVAHVRWHPRFFPCQKSKQMYIWIFSFSPQMLHKPVAGRMMHRVARPSSITDNCAFLRTRCRCVVNIFAVNQLVIPVLVAHSPGLPETNPSISRVSLCICADRKHERLHVGTSLNKSVECSRHEPAGTPREREWEGGRVRLCYSLCLLIHTHRKILKKSIMWPLKHRCRNCYW